MSEPIEYQISDVLMGTGMPDTLAERLAKEIMELFAGGVVLSRQPCNNCYKGKVCPGGERHKGVHTCTLVTCLSCSGSGTTWPYELIAAVACVPIDLLVEVMTGHSAVKVLDALALVVQEGTDT